MAKDPTTMTVDELKKELELAALDTAQMELDNVLNRSQVSLATFSELHKLGQEASSQERN